MKLGIIVQDFTASQLSYDIINNVNNFIKNKHDIDIWGFCNELNTIVIQPHFPIVQITYAWEFDGIAIATNLNTLDKLLLMPGPRKRFFYNYDLEWLRMPKKDYLTLARYYRNNDVELIVRSEDHKKVIENCWNREVLLVMEDFNIKKILDNTK